LREDRETIPSAVKKIVIPHSHLYCTFGLKYHLDNKMYRSHISYHVLLRAKLNEAQKKLEELKETSDAASGELKKGIENAWTELKKAFDQSRIKGLGVQLKISIRPHDLRRHSATYASRNGVPLEIVSKVILRHQDLKTTQAYLGKVSESESIRWMDIIHGK